MAVIQPHPNKGTCSATDPYSSGLVTGIEIDHASVPKFCDSCAKAKLNTHPLPKESDTRAEEYGKHVHWDLLGPMAVQAIDSSLYFAACIVDATQEMKLFFLKKTSETKAMYKKDEAYIET